MADITNMEGTHIPDDICSVKGRLRQSTLEFPIQKKPGKTDVEQWQFLVDSVSFDSRLHVPLGQWTRSPDQLFPYVKNLTGTSL